MRLAVLTCPLDFFLVIVVLRLVSVRRELLVGAGLGLFLGSSAMFFFLGSFEILVKRIVDRKEDE